MFSIALSVMFTSCREDRFVDGDELGGGGKTIFKIQDGPQRALFLTAFSDIQKLDLFDMRREVPNNTELNKTSTVQLVAAPQLITAYNTANPGGPLTQMPENIFTLAGSGIVKSGTGYTVTFSPGEFAKNFAINLNGALFDLSKKYALAFTVGDITNGTLTATTAKQILVLVSIKNKYEAVYSIVNGEILRYTAPGVIESPSTLNGSMIGNPDVTMKTIDANTVTLENLRWFGGGGIAGADNMRAYINPANNEVTVTALGNLSLANQPGKVNKYDPATRTFTLNFHWNPTANVRQINNLVIKYKNATP